MTVHTHVLKYMCTFAYSIYAQPVGREEYAQQAESREVYSYL